ncbi:uncharacterized conserved secreted protein (DUF218) [Synechococcus sp. SYN20]|nr:uncharacterized conserved secreted protein (DUF218) [Synechococcus sp. SYN20]
MVLASLVWASTAGPLKPFREAITTVEPPQRILVLGGDLDRERVGLRLAQQLELPLVVSGGSNPEYAQWLLRDAGMDQSRVVLDYRAKDTFTNFTSLVDDLKRDGVKHVYLVTSDDHLPRAMTVGRLVAGSRGIRLTGVPVACQPSCRKETLGKRLGDGIRALTWVITGRDLKSWALRNWPQGFPTP